MEAIVNNLIKATGWSIFHSLWQGAIIYAVLALLIAAFPKLNAKIKHNLSYSAVCIIFIGFCITFFTIFKLPASNTPQMGLVEEATGLQYAEGMASFSQEISSQAEFIFPYLVSIYGIGILLQLFILIAGYTKMLQLKSACHTPVPQQWQGVFDELVGKMNLHRRIGFYLSDKVNVPLVMGYLKPVVLFPFALATQLDLKQVEAVLIHELSHIRRNDYLLNLVKTAIETILFFNPFVWLSGKFISIEREHACDDLVLKFTGTPVTYAHALLKLEILKNKTAPTLSMAATGDNQHLYQRIKRITDMKTNYMNAKQQLFAITLTIATLVSLAWVNPARTTTPNGKHPGSEQVEIEARGIKLKLLGLPPNKAKSSTKRVMNADTTKKKKKFKIVTTDDKGNVQEFNSIKEMPDSLRREVINQGFLKNGPSFYFDTAQTLGDFKISPDQLKEFRFQFDDGAGHLNPEQWKELSKQIRENALTIAKKFRSEDFKVEQAELLKATAELKKHFNSPEWKKQMEELPKQAAGIAKRSYHFKAVPSDIKKQMDEMKTLKNSPEYKKLKKKFDEDLEKIKKKKGIKSDVTMLNVGGNVFLADIVTDLKIDQPEKKAAAETPAN